MHLVLESHLEGKTFSHCQQTLILGSSSHMVEPCEISFFHVVLSLLFFCFSIFRCCLGNHIVLSAWVQILWHTQMTQSHSKCGSVALIIFPPFFFSGSWTVGVVVCYICIKYVDHPMIRSSLPYDPLWISVTICKKNFLWWATLIYGYKNKCWKCS